MRIGTRVCLAIALLACLEARAGAWTKYLPGNAATFDLVTDGSGNVYTVGPVNGIVDFDPGRGSVLLTASDDEVFILKLTAAGDFAWVRQLSGTFYESAPRRFARAFGASLFGSGAIYASGPLRLQDVGPITPAMEVPPQDLAENRGSPISTGRSRGVLSALPGPVASYQPLASQVTSTPTASGGRIVTLVSEDGDGNGTYFNRSTVVLTYISKGD